MAGRFLDLKALAFKGIPWGKLRGKIKFNYYVWLTVFITICITVAYITVYVTYILKSEELRKKEIRKQVKVPFVLPWGKKVPRIAVILDDAGGEAPDYKAIFCLGVPLTLSILPNLPLSGKVAEKASAAHLEVMLHLPMEPNNGKYVRHDGSMILTDMSSKEAREIFLQDLKSIPNAVGFNNHMGSKATEDEKTVMAVMEAAKEKNLYFVDSRTSRTSAAYSIAKKVGLKAAKSSSFLDVQEIPLDIEEKFKELIAKAKREGSAIGIGHATRRMTIEELKRLIREAQALEIKFVYASELVR